MKWISYGQTLPARFARKSDVPIQNQYQTAVQVEFNFEIAWILRDVNRLVLMPGGSFAETFDFYLHTPGHVIGLADLSTANAWCWSEEWREVSRFDLLLLSRLRYSLSCKLNAPSAKTIFRSLRPGLPASSRPLVDERQARARPGHPSKPGERH